MEADVIAQLSQFGFSKNEGEQYKEENEGFSFLINKLVDSKFKGMINALSYGAPPHGGIAPGIDRIIMLLANEPNIREVISFPMNQQAMDLMMNAPAVIEKQRLDELGIKLNKKNN